MLNLKAIRAARGYSQSAFAQKVGLHRSSAQKIESGASRPTPENAQAIADVLGFDNWWDFYTPENAHVQWRGEAPI